MLFTLICGPSFQKLLIYHFSNSRICDHLFMRGRLAKVTSFHLAWYRILIYKTRPSNMSTFSQPASLIKRMQAEQLSAMLLDLPKDQTASKFAIVDVRSDDHIGGHIRSSLNYPSHTLDYTMSEIVRLLAEKEMVIFHCALSQERGPKAARRYLEEKERLRNSSKPATEKNEETNKQHQVLSEQEVYVLDRGFVGWQEK